MARRANFAASVVVAAGLMTSGAIASPDVVPSRVPADSSAALLPLMLNDDGRVVSVDRLSPQSLGTPSGRFELAPVMSGAGATTSPFAFSDGNVSMSGHWANTAPLASDFYRQVAPTRSLRDVRLSARLSPDFTFDLAQGRDIAAAFNPFDLRGGNYDGLFLSASALNSPYAAAVDGGTYVGGTFSLTDALRLRMGQATLARGTLTDPYALSVGALPRDFALNIGPASQSASLSTSSLELKLNDWAALALNASHAHENNPLFGVSGAAEPLNAVDTNALGISARVGFGGGWVTTMSYNEGVSHLNLARNDLLPDSNTLKSQSYGLAIAKEGVFGDDALGIAVSRPLQVYGGNSSFSSSIDAQGRLVFGGASAPYGAQAPESDIELGYVTTFLDGALALQANAGYQMNAGGERGSDGLSLVSRAKINF